MENQNALENEKKENEKHSYFQLEKNYTCFSLSLRMEIIYTFTNEKKAILALAHSHFNRNSAK